MGFEDFRSPDNAAELFETVTITMPVSMHEQMRTRARRWGMSVTEVMGRAVALDEALYGSPDREIVLRDRQAGTETIVRPI